VRQFGLLDAWCMLKCVNKLWPSPGALAQQFATRKPQRRKMLIECGTSGATPWRLEGCHGDCPLTFRVTCAAQ
jgi:hypothetical protein